MKKENISVSAIAVEWLERNRVFWKQSTYSKYFHIVHDILPKTLSFTPITSLSEKAVQAEVNKMLSQRFSISYVRDYVTIINAVLQYSADKGYVCNTKLHITFPKKKKMQMQYLSRTEQQQFMRYLLKDSDLIKLGIVFALYTGVRCGELCALQWSDIDLLEKTVTISKTMQRIQNRNNESGEKTKIIIMPPKSDDSFRTIPIPDFLASMLKDFQPKQRDAFLLTGQTDKYVEPRCMQNRFKKHLSICGIENMNFHALRHTFATRCIEVGFDIKSLSEILGHADVNTTLSLYVHSSFELKVDNMNKLNSVAI